MDTLTEHQARRLLAQAADAYARGYVTEAVETEHRVLCHADGSPCLDGCDAAALPTMLALYGGEG